MGQRLRQRQRLRHDKRTRRLSTRTGKIVTASGTALILLLGITLGGCRRLPDRTVEIERNHAALQPIPIYRGATLVKDESLTLTEGESGDPTGYATVTTYRLRGTPTTHRVLRFYEHALPALGYHCDPANERRGNNPDLSCTSGTTRLTVTGQILNGHGGYHPFHTYTLQTSATP